TASECSLLGWSCAAADCRDTAQRTNEPLPGSLPCPHARLILRSAGDSRFRHWRRPGCVPGDPLHAARHLLRERGCLGASQNWPVGRLLAARISVAGYSSASRHQEASFSMPASPGLMRLAPIATSRSTTPFL